MCYRLKRGSAIQCNKWRQFNATVQFTLTNGSLFMWSKSLMWEQTMFTKLKSVVSLHRAIDAEQLVLETTKIQCEETTVWTKTLLFKMSETCFLGNESW